MLSDAVRFYEVVIVGRTVRYSARQRYTGNYIPLVPSRT